MSFSTRKLTADTSVNSLSFGSPVRIDPDAREAVFLLKMPSLGSERAHFPHASTTVDPSSFAVVDAQRVSYVETDAILQSTVLRITSKRLQSYLESYIGSPPLRPIEFEGVLKSGTSGWARWMPFVDLLKFHVTQDSCEASPLVLMPLEEAIVAALLLNLPNNYRSLLSQSKPSAAPRHVKLAEEFVHQNAHRPLTTSTLAEHAQVSLRALFDGFVKFRGITPAQFVRRVRLERARDDLLSGDGTVLEVAERWGFGHSGNFAAHFVRQFGEKPAQIMRFGSTARSGRH